MPLRSLRASDVSALSAWLSPLATELGCERWGSEPSLRESVGAHAALLYSDDAGEAFVAYEAGAPLPGSARIDLVAVARERRRLGIGSRAALALERRLARSADRVYVRVPSQMGLALYFWLRLGYRPLLQHDWPAPREGEASAWMMRHLR